MQHAFFDLLGTSLIPKLRPNIPTGTSCNVHFVLVGVAAIWAFPDQLTMFVSDNLNLTDLAGRKEHIAQHGAEYQEDLDNHSWYLIPHT